MRDTKGSIIESWLSSAGYLTAMFTEGALESTLASSVNIKTKYPALANHEETA